MPRHPHGGKRKGAGRPKGDSPPRKVVSLTLDVAIIAQLEAAAAETGKSKSELVNQALRRFFSC